MKSVSVVGARKCSEYGRQVAQKIGEMLALNNIVTVSGMALGIDSDAHMSALKAGGKTIAVLGSGVDVCYPRQNKSLYREICQKGLIISEYPPETAPKQWHFPSRNRIISALSEVLVVVEASKNSGSIITAVAAAEQGKEVLAVPGNINSGYSEGCNRLIRDGAGIITDIYDILSTMGIEPRFKDKIEKHKSIKLGKDEKIIYETLKKQGETTIDNLAYELDKDAITISGLITAMEMKGLVSYRMGKIYIAKF
jgi:DNA processing protein